MIAAERVAAILLAAGASRRFGDEDKLLAPLGGRPLALHAADMLTGIGFGARIAACTPDAEALSAQLAAAGYTVVPGGDTMGRSIAAGIAEASRHDVDAALICLADMPYVTAAHIRALLAARGDDAPVIASAHNGIAMPPALFARAHFAALDALGGDRGAQALLAGARLIGARADDLRDIDTRDDLAAR